jgi:hypothetical protein
MAGSNVRSADPELFEAVEKLIRSVAAEQIMPRWQHLLQEQINEKTPGDLVTIADKEAEARLTEALAGLIPGSRVVGEEAVSADPRLLDGLDQGCVWLVDPLDGATSWPEAPISQLWLRCCKMAWCTPDGFSNPRISGSIWRSGVEAHFAMDPLSVCSLRGSLSLPAHSRRVMPMQTSNS